jgi:hypothetical protein
VVICGWPFAEFEANKNDIEGNYLKMLELAPEFADRVRAATREARYAGTAVLNYFRKPYGPGWALVGDAGYNKDFITGHGIHDAFRDAELCATALDEALLGASAFETAMGRYQATRDQRVLPMYELTTQLAMLEPPPLELRHLLAAAHGNQEAMDGFAQVIAGVTSPAEYFSEESVGRILATRQRAHPDDRGRGVPGAAGRGRGRPRALPSQPTRQALPLPGLTSRMPARLSSRSNVRAPPRARYPNAASCT